MFNSTELVTRVIVTEPTDGSEPTTDDDIDIMKNWSSQKAQ